MTIRVLGVALAILSFIAVAIAEEQHVNFEDADIEYGQYLSNECTSCHLLSGKESNIPNIVGLEADTFVFVLLAYKEKTIEHEVMNNIASRLGEVEIKSLAVYFASLQRD